MGNWLNSTPRWTPAQGYMIGSSLMNMVRQGWMPIKANRLAYEGQSVYWEVELRRNTEFHTVVVSDGPAVQEIMAGLSNSTRDAA